ncbi:MAG TPA: archease [Micromonosporaceae bacterium]
MTGPRSGHAILPHTADVMVSAWADTAEACLAEAVRGFVACFADTRASRPVRAVGFSFDPGPDTELLIEVLEEVVYLLDAGDEVPVQVALARTTHGGLVGEFGVAPRVAVPLVGAAPKGISRHQLRFEHLDDVWRCRFVVDV